MSATPPSVLLDRLSEARREGLDFDAAWPVAVADALAPVTSRQERRDWRTAFDATQLAWFAGWERREPLPRVRAMLALAAEAAAAA